MNEIGICRFNPAILIIVTILSACNSAFHDVGTPPPMTTSNTAFPIEAPMESQPPRIVKGIERFEMSDTSIWNKRDAIYFRDTRAYEVGDILTVTISVNDSAKLNNRSGKDTALTGKVNGNLNLALPKIAEYEGSALGQLATDLEAERGGSVNRTERIRLQVAAVVTKAAPNGNLEIYGTQEMRVNHELRLLTVQGVVRSKDISPNNTIPHEKIAEARISYGGHNTRKLKPLKKGIFNKYENHAQYGG